MKIKNIILFIIFTLFFNILPVKADITPPPFSRADIWINKKGLPVFPSAEQKKNYRGYKDNLNNFDAIPRHYDMENFKTVFIDKEQNTVLEMNEPLGHPLNEGLIAKFVDFKFGFIDTNGNWIIEPKYIGMCNSKRADGGYSRDYKCRYDYYYFNEGLAPVKYDERPIVTDYNFTHPIYDAIIPDDFEYPKPGHRRVWGKIKDNKFYISNNKTGDEGYLEYRYKTGYIDKTGKIIIETDYPVIYPFSEGLALFKAKNGKYGYMDKTGKVVIKPKFKYANSFDNGIANVEIGTGYLLLPFSAILLLFVIIAGYLARRDMKK